MNILYHFCSQKKSDKLPLQATFLYSWDWSYVFYDRMSTGTQNGPKVLYATEIKWLFLTLDNSVEQTYVIFKEKTLTNSIYIYVRIINLNYWRIFRRLIFPNKWGSYFKIQEGKIMLDCLPFKWWKNRYISKLRKYHLMLANSFYNYLLVIIFIRKFVIYDKVTQNTCLITSV